MSLKDMITQLMAAGTEIRLPALSYNSEYDSVLLLNEQLVRSITVKKESTTNQSSYDLQCELSDGQLLLSMFRSSGNQRFANAEYPPKRILALRLDRINLSNAEYTDYKQAICQFLEVETVGKEWISHPRLTQYVAELEAEERQRRRDEELLQQQLLDFECIMCHVTWRGTNKERTCAKCGKHVYTREI
ncbi:MAG: hypothetical protein JJ890_05870 [Pseudomonadales bacterium]|nr:hypothetical protein [Pseudomonadales bacterium]